MKKVQIGENFYEVEIKNGISYIDGKTVDEFAKSLSEEDTKKNGKGRSNDH